jgi:hypothetical protein
MNRNKLKNIILEEYQKIKHDLQEQSMGGQSMSPGGQPFMNKSADPVKTPYAQTIYKGVSSGKEVSIETLKKWYEEDITADDRSTGYSFNDYLDQLVKQKTITKQSKTAGVNQIGMPNETDKTTIALAAGASGKLASGLGGTIEKLIDAAIYGGTYKNVKLQGITDLKIMKIVSNNLQKLLKSLNTYDTILDQEYIALRDSKAIAMKKSVVRTRTGGLSAEDVRLNLTNIVKYAIMSDGALDSVGFTDNTLKNGIFGILDSEFEGRVLDKYALHFLNNGMAQISIADSAVVPLDGTGYKIALTQSPIELPDKVNGITQYQL